MPRPTPRATPFGPLEEAPELGEEVAGAPVWDVEGDAEEDASGEPDEAEVLVIEDAAEVAVEEAADVWV